MDPFNGNRWLEENAIYGLDWGLFLRHDLTEMIIPFMLLFDGDKIYFNTLVTETDPVEYAFHVLKNETRNFQQIVIGMEGYLRDDTTQERMDAIIVHAYDRSQTKGVVIGQRMVPKEKNGLFQKVDRPSILGQPDLPFPSTGMLNPKSINEDIELHLMSKLTNGLKDYSIMLTGKNPSGLAYQVRRALQNLLKDNGTSEASGSFEFYITPGHVASHDFVRFLVVDALQEERNAPYAKNWENKYNRKIRFRCMHGDQPILVEFEGEKENSAMSQRERHESRADYAHLTDKQLDSEFYKLRAIPNGRTNVAVLTAMSKVLEEYEKRNLTDPAQRASSNKNRPWWKFW